MNPEPMIIPHTVLRDYARWMTDNDPTALEQALRFFTGSANMVYAVPESEQGVGAEQWLNTGHADDLLADVRRIFPRVRFIGLDGRAIGEPEPVTEEPEPAPRPAVQATFELIGLAA